MIIRGCFAAGIVLLAGAGTYAAWPRDNVAAVPQTWASSGISPAETDSLAACQLRDGSVMVYATQKTGDRIDVFNAETGKFVRSVGKSGDGPGEFKRPNGVIVLDGNRFDSGSDFGPILLVIERDGARVQAFRAEDMRWLGSFGKGELNRPYGAGASYTKDGVFVYVTDTKFDPEQTVKVYRVTFDGKTLTARLVRKFGDRDGKGKIKTAESIAVEDQNDRLLICDEHESRRNVKVYTREGRFTGTTFADGHIKREPEGIVVCETGNVIIVTDQQKDLTVWHVFDRKTLKHVGAVTGTPTIANTDGICLYEKGIGEFARGALFAVNDDADVRGYKLDAILAAASGSAD